jgi:glycosyltransferase involved in cell wall biosynthesis
MKISIITPTYNSSATIAMCLQSVNMQTFPDIEHIIIDGASRDNTINIIHLNQGRVNKIISEPDHGMYDAMNKGIKIATGDIVGILNADDFFSDIYVLEKIVTVFQNETIDALYGDVRFVDPSNTDKIVRYYSSKKFTPSKFRFGFMPAHPSFYARRELFQEYGYYKEDYQIAADFELLIRFLYTNKLKSRYLEIPFVSMRTGGISNKSIWSRFILNKEILRACKENGINTNFINIYSKYFIKVFELFGN